jgi:hypothetical protein
MTFRRRPEAGRPAAEATFQGKSPSLPVAEASGRRRKPSGRRRKRLRRCRTVRGANLDR